LDNHGVKGRVNWLLRQPPEHLGSSFRPQPFEQLVKVLREMGHEKDAIQIAVAKQRMRRWAKWATISQDILKKPRHRRELAAKLFQTIKTLLAAIGLFFEWVIFDLFLGSGYAKVRPVLFFLVILFGCAWYYHLAAARSAFAPTNPLIYNDPDVRKACAGTKEIPDVVTPIDWYRCQKEPFELNPFRPLVYSVDQMIPFLQLGQKRDWQPISRKLHFDLWGIAQVTLPASTTMIVTWTQSIGSTLLYLLIVAILGGLIKRD
jgi:hypothetical protein